MSHTYGLFTLLACLVLGHKYVLIKKYYEETFLKYIETFGVSIFPKEMKVTFCECVIPICSVF